MLTNQQKIIGAVGGGCAILFAVACCGVGGMFVVLPIFQRGPEKQIAAADPAPDKAGAPVPQKVANQEPMPFSLQTFKKGEVKAPIEKFRVGWKGTLDGYSGYQCKVERVFNSSQASVACGTPDVVAGWNVKQTAILISNIDTSRMADYAEIAWNDPLFKDVYEISETTRVGNRTYLHMRRIGTVAK